MAKRIMVVDDSRMIGMQMRNLLEDTDYEVAAYCRDGEEAIDQYGQVQPDLVTMDIIMPGMDGLMTTPLRRPKPSGQRASSTSPLRRSSCWRRSGRY